MATTLKSKSNHLNVKRFFTIEEIKSKIETGAVGDTKNRVSEVFRGRSLAKSLRANKLAMKKSLRNLSLGVEFKL